MARLHAEYSLHKRDLKLSCRAGKLLEGRCAHVRPMAHIISRAGKLVEIRCAHARPMELIISRAEKLVEGRCAHARPMAHIISRVGKLMEGRPRYKSTVEHVFPIALQSPRKMKHKEWSIQVVKRLGKSLTFFSILISHLFQQKY